MVTQRRPVLPPLWLRAVYYSFRLCSLAVSAGAPPAAPPAPGVSPHPTPPQCPAPAACARCVRRPRRTVRRGFALVRGCRLGLVDIGRWSVSEVCGVECPRRPALGRNGYITFLEQNR